MAELQALLTEFKEGFDGVTSSLSTALGSLGIFQTVETFDGTDPTKFREWEKSLEKFATLENLTGSTINLMALKTAKGSVSTFLQRYLRTNPTATWEVVKKELKSRFAEITDSSHAFDMLKKLKQEKNERVQVYGERLLALAEETYKGTDLGYYVPRDT